jgi:hypothetical protein
MPIMVFRDLELPSAGSCIAHFPSVSPQCRCIRMMLHLGTLYGSVVSREDFPDYSTNSNDKITFPCAFTANIKRKKCDTAPAIGVRRSIWSSDRLIVSIG